MKSIFSFLFYWISSEPLDLRMVNFVYRQIITILTNTFRNIVYKSTNGNMATMRNFAIMLENLTYIEPAFK